MLSDEQRFVNLLNAKALVLGEEAPTQYASFEALDDEDKNTVLILIDIAKRFAAGEGG